ncbi:hypothetical protein DH2020_040401 [Rehmannia glutinosa]|uniref:Uncharacterized protein n=1 Tax=Rehmannia glutinosa TaxID=99300 RepID=A0ABR0UUB2_REHGL
MSNQKLPSDSVIGLRYRGNSLGLPSASRHRSGHMHSGMNVSRRIDNLSESDIDTSDSEANYLDRLGGRGGGFSTAHRGFVYDESSESVTSSEVNSTPPKSNNGILLERKTFNPGANLSGTSMQPNKDSMKQGFQNSSQQNKFYDDDIPSAPPMAGSFQHSNQASEKLPTCTADANRCSAKSGGSAAEVEPNKYKSKMLGSTEVETPDVSVRNAAVSSHPLPAKYPTFHARLKHVLLQSEEELLKKDSTDLVSEGAYVKTKKSIGKIKVQVRKVKMGLEPPTGCTFTSLKSSSMVKLESFQLRLSNVKAIVSAERRASRRERITPVMTLNGSLLNQSMAYIIVGTRRYLKEVPELIKISFNAWRSSSSSYEVVQESYSCLLRLKSSPEENAARMQPGSGETRVFLPDGFGDDLTIEVHDSKGKCCGHALVQVADIADESGEKLRQCLIYREPEHEQVGKIQLYISYSTTPDENSHKVKGMKLQNSAFAFDSVGEAMKMCASVAETVAYDCVLETAMKVQQFQQRNLLLHGSWRWLVTEFASYFGVSDAYTKLRYLSYVMDVATPTADCLDLVHDLLQPVIIKGKTKHTLSHQEVGAFKMNFNFIILLVGAIVVFSCLFMNLESYCTFDWTEWSVYWEKCLIKLSRYSLCFSRITSRWMNLSLRNRRCVWTCYRVAAPALAPALKLYKLLYDILSPENATRKRSRRHLSETDEFVSSNNENVLLDPVALSTAYKKMKLLCLNIRNEILTDIEIHKQDLLPSFIDLPNLSSSIYSTELYNRLRTFLVSCPPAGPSPPVVELVIATADFQRDLSLWNISYIKGGVDAKELFHVYITLWIQDKRLALLELCKLDRVKSSSFPTQHSTTPFIDDIYGRLKDTLAEYDVIISRWPEYTFALENAIADVEKAVVESLEKQYAEVLSPLKENTIPIKFGLKYVQRFAKGNTPPYNVSTELGVVLNSMKRMLEILRPQIESQLKMWGSCMPESGNMVPGERLSEITVMIRSKFRAYVQAVIDKLVENVSLCIVVTNFLARFLTCGEQFLLPASRSKLHNVTKLKKIIQDAKENVIESDLRQRMQPLKELLANTIDQLHTVLETQVFVIVCRGFWDRMGQDVLKFLEDRKENRSWYKASRVAVTIAFLLLVLDDTFASQMQQLLGNAIQEKDLEPHDVSWKFDRCSAKMS